MRIGIVINSSWNIYNFRIGLIKSFLQSNHSVIAIAPDDGYASQLRDLGCEFYDINMDGKGSNPLNDLQLTKRLYDTYKEARLDVVLHYTIKPNIYGTMAAKLLKIPCINNVTGLGTVFLRENLTAKIGKLLYKVAFRYPRVVFFQNTDDQQLFIDQKLVRKEITDILPGSGIDTSHFQPAGFRKNSVFTFLLIARVLYDKGILEYIDAIRLLKKQGVKARFCLLGKIDPSKGLGIPQEHIDAWVAEGLIDYLGTVEDVRPVISEADCIILPSYREGTPRTLLEAASLGKPIIATDVPGCRETVDDNFNGFLCKVKDPQDLADKMRTIMSVGDYTLKRMGDHSRRLAVERFDHNIVIEKYQNALCLVPSQKLERIRV